MIRKRVKGLILAIAASLLLLEALLQAAAFYVWLRHKPGAVTIESDERVILCLGDSLTFGTGASGPDKSYPSQLEAILRAPGMDARWRVVNGGWSGHGSRDILSRLEGQLRSIRPEQVYLMVGLNDYWNRPAELVLPPTGSGSQADPDSFPIRFRTGRLVQIIRLRWTPSIRRAIEGRGTPAAGVPREPVDPGDPRPDARGWEALDRGAFAEAAGWFQEDLQHNPDNAWSHHGLVCCYSRLSRQGEALAEVEWLRQNLARDQRATAAQPLFASLEAVGANREQFELAQRMVELDPGFSEAWFQLARGAFEAGDVEAARTSLERALASSEESDRQTRRRDLFRAYHLIHDSDPPASLSCLIRILLDTGDPEPFRREIEGNPEQATREILERALSMLALTQEQEELVLETYAQAPDDGRQESVLKTLESHLRQFVGRCRDHGARPVLLTYPVWHGELRGVFAEIARENGAELVDLDPAFARALSRRGREELFVPNGHCSDAGYRIVADVVASHVLAPEAR